MQDALLIERIHNIYHALYPEMDERMRRHWAAAEALEIGWGGVTAVAIATGLSRTTITAALAELDLPASTRQIEAARVRRPGGGRWALIRKDPELPAALEALIEPSTRGDPESALRWTCKSTSHLARTLTWQGHPIGPRTVAALLHEAGYSFQANRKTTEGRQHPDRDGQFRYINRIVKRHLHLGGPAVSVDTKKKELVGDFRNFGREWRPRGTPQKVRVHDFIDKKLGKAIPYGVYDIQNNQGWVSVGIDHDTAQFAAGSIRRWWGRMGCRRFPKARQLLVTADGGGSNGSRSRLWKVCLQELADELEMELVMCHFPPGTSKWNKIEHRLFSFITQNWRGRPLLNHETIVNLIASTCTQNGLVVKAALDTNQYETKIKVRAMKNWRR
jgi:Rhodopirellula transposase DDE domain